MSDLEKRFSNPTNKPYPERSSLEFQLGAESGSKAEDVSILEQSRTPKPETGIYVERDSFLRGYVQGLKTFIAAHKVGIWVTPDALTEGDTLKGYLKGLRRESPNVAGEIPKKSTENFKEGYRLGFVVSVARDFDINLNLFHELPSDDPAYNAFMAGFRAEPRALPIDNMYHTGLKVWLRTQGAVNVSTHEIRNPKALNAFKAGLNGEDLPEDLRQRPHPVRLYYERDFLDNQPDFIEQIRRQEIEAYRLGLETRKVREAKSR